MSNGKVTPISAGDMGNPALRHAMEQGRANIPPPNKCIRLVAQTGQIYHIPMKGLEEIVQSPLGVAFRVAYQADESQVYVGSDLPPIKRIEALTFVNVGFTLETIDKPAWWAAVERPEKSKIVQ